MALWSFRNGADIALVLSVPLAILLVCLVVRLVLVIKNKDEQPATLNFDEQSRQNRIEELKKQAIEEFLKNIPQNRSSCEESAQKNDEGATSKNSEEV